MPRAEAGMASLFDVSLRPSEPADQEISEALLGTWQILRRVHRPQKVILRNLSIEGGDQACETFCANHRINFEFLHVFALLIQLFSYIKFLTKFGYRCLLRHPNDRGSLNPLDAPDTVLRGDFEHEHHERVVGRPHRRPVGGGQSQKCSSDFNRGSSSQLCTSQSWLNQSQQ